MTPKILVHDDGAIYCVHKNGQYKVTLSDEENPEPVVTEKHGTLRWVPVVIVAGNITDVVSQWPED